MRPGLAASFTPLLASVLGLAIAGCGYSPVRYREADGAQRRVAIRTLENDSSERGVEQLVGQALRREFLGRGGTRLVSNPRQADVVIEGRIPQIRIRARSFTSVVLALEYELTLRLDLRLASGRGRRLGEGKLELEDTEVYLASADVEVMRKNRQEALRRVADMLAVRVHDAVDRAADAGGGARSPAVQAEPPAAVELPE